MRSMRSQWMRSIHHLFSFYLRTFFFFFFNGFPLFPPLVCLAFSCAYSTFTRTTIPDHTHTHTSPNVFFLLYICMYVCVYETRASFFFFICLFDAHL